VLRSRYQAAQILVVGTSAGRHLGTAQLYEIHR
jgi:hypothetical protein